MLRHLNTTNTTESELDNDLISKDLVWKLAILTSVFLLVLSLILTILVLLCFKSQKIFLIKRITLKF